MRFVLPSGFHNDITDLDDAVMGECIVEVLDCRGEIIVSFAFRVLLIETSELIVIVYHAVLRGFRQTPALSIESLHRGVNGNVRAGHFLLASHKGKSEHRQEQTQENPATRG